MIFLGSILILINTALAQKIGFGKCPAVNAMKDFSILLYIGHWYEYARYPSVLEFGTSCMKSEFKLNRQLKIRGNKYDSNNDKNVGDTFGYGYPVVVQNTGTRNLLFKKVDTLTESKVRLEDPSSRDGKLIMSAYGINRRYTILDTDYLRFSLMWSCTDYFGLFHLKSFWAYTYNRNPDKESIDRLYRGIEKLKHISQHELVASNQKACNN